MAIVNSSVNHPMDRNDYDHRLIYVGLRVCQWCPLRTSADSLDLTMASIACESVHNSDIKTQFVTREGYYKLMTSAEYSRPNRLGYTTQTNNTAVKVSFVTTINTSTDNDSGSPIGSTADRICFNVGRELYVYTYKGVKKVGLGRALASCLPLGPTHHWSVGHS